MVAYSIDEVKSKCLRKAVKVYDLKKLKLIPINEREQPNKEILLVDAVSGHKVIDRDELSSLGYTYVDGKPIKLSKLSSSYTVYIVKKSKENVNVAYIPKDRYVEYKGKKISGKYIIVYENGKVSTCSKKVFHKIFRFLPDVRFDNIFEKVMNRKMEDKLPRFRIEAKVKGRKGLTGYIIEDTKTGNVSSYSVAEAVCLVKNGKVQGDVRVAKNMNNKEFLKGAVIDSVQTVQG